MKNNKINYDKWKYNFSIIKNIFFRLVLSLIFGILIGIILSIIQRKVGYNDFNKMWYLISTVLKKSILLILVLTIILFFISFHSDKKYQELLTKKLDPEKFIEKTEKRYKKFKKNKNINKEIYKINLSIGYYNWGKFDKAKEYFENIDKKKLFEYVKKKKINKVIEINYYHMLTLFLYREGKKKEALEIYKEKIKDSIKNGMLKIILFYEDDSKKMISEIEEALKIKSSKIEELFFKYNLAENKEKIGEIGQAKKLYQEVAETGNKIFIVGLAQEKLKNIK